jgi:hypothetical protein
MFWNIISARLAFIIVFEHVIYFTVYLIQWLVPDVPKTIQNKIDHERYIDQRERWASKASEDHFKDAIIASEALSKMMNRSNGIIKMPINEMSTTLNHARNRKGQVGVEVSTDSES